MGKLFKVIAFADPKLGELPGFESWHVDGETHDGRVAGAATDAPCCRPLRCRRCPASATPSSPAQGGVSDGVYASLNGGIGSNDAPAHVAENRARMAAALGVAPERFLTAYQIHSPEVVTVERPWAPDARPRADAIVTRVPGIAVGVSTADCGPVLFADAGARVIGAAHAGWRGALTGVIEATIAAMERSAPSAAASSPRSGR